MCIFLRNISEIDAFARANLETPKRFYNVNLFTRIRTSVLFTFAFLNLAACIQNDQVFTVDCNGRLMDILPGHRIVYRGVGYKVTHYERIGNRGINEIEAEGATYVVDFDGDRYFKVDSGTVAVFYRKDNPQGERTLCTSIRPAPLR